MSTSKVEFITLKCFMNKMVRTKPIQDFDTAIILLAKIYILTWIFLYSFVRLVELFFFFNLFFWFVVYLGFYSNTVVTFIFDHVVIILFEFFLAKI